MFGDQYKKCIASTLRQPIGIEEHGCEGMIPFIKKCSIISETLPNSLNIDEIQTSTADGSCAFTPKRSPRVAIAC